MSDLQFISFGDLAAADQLDGLADHLDELIVVFAHLAEQLNLVFGDKLEPVEVVAELIQLAQRGVKGAIVVDQQRGRDAVELRRGIVLELAVSGDFSLQLDQILGAPVGIVQRLETDGAERDKQHRDSEERDK